MNGVRFYICFFALFGAIFKENSEEIGNKKIESDNT